MGRLEGSGLRFVEMNRQPGLLMETRDGELMGAMSLDIAEGQVQGIRSIVNPDKLARLGPVADVKKLLDELRGRR
jgi:RNA polymerase sigma-70 factor (ECF subfamily)